MIAQTHGQIDFNRMRIRDSIYVGVPEGTAGNIRVGGSFYFPVRRKPCWLHRLLLRALLGMEWVEHKDVFMLKGEKE